jgi:phospholipase C
MGFYLAPQVPMADFFAREFSICDRWVASLPTGTQPNRLMAMSGMTTRDTNAPFLLTNQELVYDWLDRHSIRWRVYHRGPIPFFALMRRWQAEIAQDLAINLLGIHTRFRRYEYFDRDFYRDPTLPPVIFLEPEYTDGPHLTPNDDHPPTLITAGQAFLYSIYRTVMKRPDRWLKTLLVLTYDEHGGFFDHVPPLRLRTDPPPGHPYDPFETTGVRVPALLISPFVERGGVFSEPLDHTSLLGLLADRFTPGQAYLTRSPCDHHPSLDWRPHSPDWSPVRTSPRRPLLPRSRSRRLLALQHRVRRRAWPAALRTTRKPFA